MVMCTIVKWDYTDTNHFNHPSRHTSTRQAINWSRLTGAAYKRETFGLLHHTGLLTGILTLILNSVLWLYELRVLSIEYTNHKCKNRKLACAHIHQISFWLFLIKPCRRRTTPTAHYADDIAPPQNICEIYEPPGVLTREGRQILINFTEKRVLVLVPYTCDVTQTEMGFDGIFKKNTPQLMKALGRW